jgi:hypothetical protein
MTGRTGQHPEITADLVREGRESMTEETRP